MVRADHICRARDLRIALILCIAALSRGAFASAPELRPPAEAFAQLPTIDLAAVSPNGKLLARDRNAGGATSLEIWDLDAGKLMKTVGIHTGERLLDVNWADDQTVLIDVGATVDFECRPPQDCLYDVNVTQAVDVAGGKPTVLAANGFGGRLISTFGAMPHTVLMVSWERKFAPQADSGKSPSSNRLDRATQRLPRVVYQVDTRTSSGEIVARGTADTVSWIVDRYGQVVARGDWLPLSNEFSVFVRDGDDWRRILQTTGDFLDLAGLTMDDKSIVALGRIGSDRRKAWAIPLDGSERTILFEDPVGEVAWGPVCLDKYTRTVGCLLVTTPGAEVTVAHWFDDDRAAHDRSLRSAFPGRRVVIDGVSASADAQRVVAIIDGPSSPREWRLVDFSKSRADIIDEAYPALAKAPLGTVEAISYLSRDGKTIPAVLITPPGAERRNLPLVVLPHDMFYGDDVNSFDWLDQFLATRGYLVLLPQYRGSGGYGRAHEEAGDGQWGGISQHDITDGVRHLIATGMADPKRICIAGFGYGGYSALWGAAFAPDVYACAASIGGFSDIAAFVAKTSQRSGRYSKYTEYWVDKIGSPSDPKLAEWSPARHADRVKAPVLLMHGTAETTVPIAQSEIMERELKRAGKSVEFVRLPGGDNEMSRTETRLEVLNELESFLAKYLGQ